MLNMSNICSGGSLEITCIVLYIKHSPVVRVTLGDEVELHLVGAQCRE
jgi:hypothetical protein